MVGKNFHSNGVQITGKCICKSKKLKGDIFTHVLCQAKFFPRFLSSPPRQREIIYPTRQYFFFKYLSPSRKGRERKLCCKYNKEYIMNCFTKRKQKKLYTNRKNDEWIFFLITKNAFEMLLEHVYEVFRPLSFKVSYIITIVCLSFCLSVCHIGIFLRNDSLVFSDFLHDGR